MREFIAWTVALILVTSLLLAFAWAFQDNDCFPRQMFSPKVTVGHR
jgi:type IV secretory pathway TrbL component